MTVAAMTDLEELFARRYPELARLAYLLTGDPSTAEDLAQDAFVRAWPRLGDLVSPDKAMPYLRTTLLNLVRQRHRRRLVEWRHRPAPLDPVPGPDTDRADALDLARLVRTLPLRKRACIVLRYYEDLSEQETAEALGVSIGTVKSQTHKALRHLAALLAEESAEVRTPR